MGLTVVRMFTECLLCARYCPKCFTRIFSLNFHSAITHGTFVFFYLKSHENYCLKIQKMQQTLFTEHLVPLLFPSSWPGEHRSCSVYQYANQFPVSLSHSKEYDAAQSNEAQVGVYFGVGQGMRPDPFLLSFFLPYLWALYAAALSPF